MPSKPGKQRARERKTNLDKEIKATMEEQCAASDSYESVDANTEYTSSLHDSTSWKK
jgi:hypothetical protein